MPIPTNSASALAARQRFMEAEQQRQQCTLGMGLGALAGMAGGLAQQRQQSYANYYAPESETKKEPEGIREELQAETDEWLRDKND